MLRFLLALSALSPILLLRCMMGPCTMAGCGVPLEVGFTGATDKPGHYRIDVVADGVPSWCEITLPRTCDALPMCSAPQLPWVMSIRGCDGKETVEAVRFATLAPTTVEIVVRRDDMIVGQTNERPAYYETYPNGASCDPDCRQARMVTALAP